MKRLLLWGLLSAVVAPVALATTNYINSGTVSIMSPPQVAPQIDASNFVNTGTFYITNTYANGVQPTAPYQSWNTRNWTNFNRMAGDSGFRFDYFDSAGGTNAWSETFQNASSGTLTNARIFGAVYLQAYSTNLNNKGTMMVGGSGLLSLAGQNVDLSQSSLGAVGNETNDLAGVRDLYWGTNESVLTASFTANSAQSGFTLVTEIDTVTAPPTYAQLFQTLRFVNACGTNIVCTNGYTAYITTNQVFFGGAIRSAIDVLFLRQTNPAISTEVRFDTFGSPGAEKFVQFQALQTNRVNGAVTTNRLFLTDTFGDWFIPPFLRQTPSPNFFYGLFAAARFRPINYSITHAAPVGYDALPILPPRLVDPFVFSGTNFPTFETNVAWAANLTAAYFPPDPTIEGSTWTNVPGRIEVAASGPGSYLELARTRIDGETYLLLSATNHFVGSTNASIISPVSDIYLASTNGMMAISNLTTPFVPRMEGVVQVWSGRWTNITAQGLGTLYTVTMVDTALIASTPSQIQNLSLRSTNLLIGDALNVFGSLLLDTTRLTISTNAAKAPTPYGELNLTSGDLWWSASLPQLQYLTNLGQISSLNTIYFASNNVTPPWFSGTFDGPYESFVSHGYILSQGNATWAKYYEAGGTNDSGVGPLSVQSDFAIITNGAFLTPEADITLTSGSLLISNQFLQAGRGISLTVTNYLDDGSLSNSVDVITNKNTWTVGTGISLMRMPTAASLFGTTVTNTALPNTLVVNYWSGQDRGCWPSGFTNNAALGRLILDGQDDGSLFTFLRTGPTNALYVDLLEFKNAATNVASGNLPDTLDFVGVNLDTNFTIYYAQAIVNGQSIAEKLNGSCGVADTNGGRFRWVSNFNTGFWSSTNVVYSDGTTNRLNAALVASCTIDSNGNGIPNCVDTNPIPVLSPSGIALTVTVTHSPAPAALLSWTPIPFTSNYLYAVTSPSPWRPTGSW